MKQTLVVFSCEGIDLEGVWHFPETNNRLPAVVICHPHPLYGGSMSNPVVFTICQSLATQGIAALRFNFRGVGNSKGDFGGGVNEQDDVRSALLVASTAPHVDPNKIGLAGYSFGASVALPVAVNDGRVRLLALVSPALTESGWEQLKRYPSPKLLIIGNHDFVTPLSQFEKYIKEVPEPKQHHVIYGADHFWMGYEDKVAQKVTEFFIGGFKE